MKDRLKAMFTQNIGMKLVSIVLALLVWMSIINLADPKVTRTISDIPIEKRNEDLVNVENKTYVSNSPNTVTIRIYGNRSEIENYSADDFTAYVDFSEMSSVNAVPVHVVPKSDKMKDTVEITKQSVTMYTGKIEETKESRYQIYVRISGVPDHYYARSYNPSADSLTVSGSNKIIESIDHLVANIDLHENTKSVTGVEVPLTAEDRNGKSVDLTGIRLPQSSILVNIEVLPVQDIKIVLDTTNVKAASGWAIDYENIEYTTSMPLAGEAEVLSKIEQIVIPYTVYDQIGSLETSVSILRYLPDGVYVASDSDQISIKIPLERKQEKSFNVRTATISVRNLDEIMKYAFLDETVELNVYDLGKRLAEISEVDLGLYIDLGDIHKAGEYTVPLHSVLQVADESLAEDEILVKVRVELRDDENNPGGNDSRE
ncbi:MAG: hypothetical protein J6Y26_04035 [Lachnospiraceae bacterium]|nr:hypothetical protein [Lachnospiraceae bacterium]